MLLSPSKRGVAVAAFAFALTGSALAQDQREMTTPSDWTWLHGASPAQITAKRSAGYRLVNLEHETTRPIKFSAAFVKNSGAYKKSSTWYYGTPLYVAGQLKNFDGRVIDLEPYVYGGQVHLAAVMVKNTGSEKKLARWGYGATLSSLTNKLKTYNARLVDLDSYWLNGKTYYTYVMIPNQGKDYRASWWYPNLTKTAIEQKLASHKARIYDIERASASGFNVIMIKSDHANWWRTGLTAKQVDDLAGNTGSRIVDIDGYFTFTGSRRFNVILNHNTNDLTLRIGDVLRKSDGNVGAYLKRVNGPELAFLNTRRRFHPRQTINTLMHVAALHRVRQGATKLSKKITVYIGDKSSCPKPSIPTYETLQTVLDKMMRESDNYRAFAVETHIARSVINGVATTLGMPDMRMYHTVGCTSLVPNRTTLADNGKLLEKVATGWLGPQKSNFYALMHGGSFGTFVSQEAAKLGLPGIVVNSFNSYVKRTHMGGFANIKRSNSWLYNRSKMGWMRLPFCINNKLELREYVVCTFIDGATDGNAANTANTNAWNAMVRDRIHEALKTWKNSRVPGKFTVFGSGCNGSNGVPTHYGVGLAQTGSSSSYGMQKGPKNGIVLLALGLSKQKWGAIPLPLDLTPLGATGCKLYTAIGITFPGVTSSTGSVGKLIPIPNDPNLVGASFFTQYICVDKANSLGLTFSNGLETKLGGYPK